MNIGNLEQLDMALLPQPLLNLLRKTEYSFERLLEKEDGKYDIIDDSVFYLILTTVTSPEGNCKSEFHNKYIDIQVLISGEEIIAVSNSITNPEEYDEIKPDLIFLEDDSLTTRIVLKPGDFAVFYPGEVHRPTCQLNGPSNIKKAVFKISKTWLSNN